MTLFGMTIEEFIAAISAIVVLLVTIAKANKHDAQTASTEQVYVILNSQITELKKSNKIYRTFYRAVLRSLEAAIDVLEKTKSKIEEEVADGNFEF